MVTLKNNSIGKQQIFDALHKVMDPEIPVLSVIDLGMISGVETKNEKVLVKMVPTFTACPAIQLMKNEIREKLLLLGFEDVEVIVDSSVVWNSDRMSDEGKEKLQQFGLGTPLRHQGEFHLSDIEHSTCPHCGSSNTTLSSLFGSTLCRSIHYCFDCRQSFERFKPL